MFGGAPTHDTEIGAASLSISTATGRCLVYYTDLSLATLLRAHEIGLFTIYWTDKTTPLPVSTCRLFPTRLDYEAGITWLATIAFLPLLARVLSGKTEKATTVMKEMTSVVHDIVCVFTHGIAFNILYP